MSSQRSPDHGLCRTLRSLRCRVTKEKKTDGKTEVKKRHKRDRETARDGETAKETARDGKIRH